eukprot:s1438_g1.t1
MCPTALMVVLLVEPLQLLPPPCLPLRMVTLVMRLALPVVKIQLLAMGMMVPALRARRMMVDPTWMMMTLTSSWLRSLIRTASQPLEGESDVEHVNQKWEYFQESQDDPDQPRDDPTDMPPHGAVLPSDGNLSVGGEVGESNPDPIPAFQTPRTLIWCLLRRMSPGMLKRRGEEVAARLAELRPGTTGTDNLETLDYDPELAAASVPPETAICIEDHDSPEKAAAAEACLGPSDPEAVAIAAPVASEATSSVQTELGADRDQDLLDVQARSGSAHWDLEFVVEVQQQCPLSSGTRG